MKTLISFANMTVEDKLLVMETLWEDLCSLPQAEEPPNWRHDILQEREHALKTGADEVLDWDEAKRMIRERTR